MELFCERRRQCEVGIVTHDGRVFAASGSAVNGHNVREWDDDGDLMFQIPERVAWEINELAEEEGYSWACFAPALNDFC
jgi:hypothetical protein